MSVTRGTRLINKVLAFSARVNKNEPIITRRSSNITESSILLSIKPLENGKVTRENFEYSIHLLEQLTEKRQAPSPNIARYIAKRIVPGVIDSISIHEANLCDTDKTIIEASLGNTEVYRRILKNQGILESRFDLKHLCSENKYLPNIVYEFCKRVDTYDVSTECKFNIALENSFCTLVKNNIPIKNDVDVVNCVLEYFLTRDIAISDYNYKTMQYLVMDTPMYAVESATGLVSEFIKTSGNSFRNIVQSVLECNCPDYSSLINDIICMETEAQCKAYVDKCKDIIDNTDDQNTVDGLVYSITSIPRITNISNDFVGLCMQDRLGEIPHKKPIIPENADDEQDDAASFLESSITASISDTITSFKISQIKNLKKVEQTFEGFKKNRKDAMDSIDAIFKFAQIVIIIFLVYKNWAVISKILGIILSFVEWLFSKSFKATEIDCINKHVEQFSSDVERLALTTQDDQCKKGLLQFSATLKLKCRPIVNTINTESVCADQYIDEQYDPVEVVNTIIEAAESISSDQSDIDDIKLEEMVELAIDGNCLGSLTEMVLKSSVPIAKYKRILTEYIKESNSYQANTLIDLSLYHINNNQRSYDDSVYSLMETYYSNNELLSLNREIVTEKVDLNTIKLALMNAQKKMKNMNTKVRSAWQTLNAHANSFMKSMEDAATSDRRERIITGKIFPSFDKLVKTGVTLAGLGIFSGSVVLPAIAAMGALGVNKSLDDKQRQAIYDELDTELKVVEKQLDIAQNENDMNQYRFLLNYQKSLMRERQRILNGIRRSSGNSKSMPKALPYGKDNM